MKVLVIGTVHPLQYNHEGFPGYPDDPGLADQRKAQKHSHRLWLHDLIRTAEPSLIFDEAPLHYHLLHGKSTMYIPPEYGKLWIWMGTPLTAQTFAAYLVDPTDPAHFGIRFAARETYWLYVITSSLEMLRTSLIPIEVIAVVCGGDHLASFSSKLADAGFQVEVHSVRDQSWYDEKSLLSNQDLI